MQSELDAQEHYSLRHSVGMEPRELLRALMSRAGDNPNSLAAAIRDPSKQGQIWRFLQGQTKEPRATTLDPIAARYGVPVEAFRSWDAASRVAEELGLLDGGSVPSKEEAVPMKNQAAELTAVQVVLLALINSHSDKGALLAAFDGIVSGIQHASENAGGLPEATRVALQRFRTQIAGQLG